MKNLKLTIEYVGTSYHGWQSQPGLPTVQGVLQEALSAASRQPVALRGAARTDAGVHAVGQVASLQVSDRVEPHRLQGHVNSLLPDDIGVRRVDVVPESFHARHSARGRVYRYQIVDEGFISPFLRPFAAHSRRPLDVEAMDTAARLLIGRRDFSAFRAAGDLSESSVKEIRRSAIAIEDGALRVITYTVEADSFLQHMVRNIAGTLMEVGRGRFTPGKISEILDARDRRLAGPTAPALGLCLEEVLYDDLARAEGGC